MKQISLRVDDGVKENAELVCAELGISMSTAINIYLKKIGREHRIPFDVSVDPFYSNENQLRLKHAAEEMENTGGNFHEVEEIC